MEGFEQLTSALRALDAPQLAARAERDMTPDEAALLGSELLVFAGRLYNFADDPAEVRQLDTISMFGSCFVACGESETP